MLEIEQSWKNYRTMINDHLAVISVNMDVFSDFSSPKYRKVAHFCRFYDADEDGLPIPEQQEPMFRDLVKVLTQLSALPDVLYAGHIISNGKVQIYFYLDDEQIFIETAAQFVKSTEIIIQDDPDWDIYFDFLLPSKVEMKFSMTEEILDSMVCNGLDLSLIYTIEHRFRFEHQNEMEEFIEQCSLSNLFFTTIKYTDAPVQLDNMEQSMYLLKLEQEIALDTQEIFKIVDQLETLCQDYKCEYIGWEYIESQRDKKYLN